MTSCFCQLVPLSHVLGMQHEISKTTQPGPTGCNWLDVVKTSYLHCNCCRGCFFLWCCSCARPHCKDADHGSTLMNSLLRLLWTQGPSWSWNTEIRPLKFSASSLAKAWASLWNGSYDFSNSATETNARVLVTRLLGCSHYRRGHGSSPN